MRAEILGVALVLSTAPPSVAQQETPAETYWVDFEAGEVELDPALKRLRLDDGVVVVVDRYRLRSPRLLLTRGPRGVHVEGHGVLAFCPCPDPPVSVGFSGATVAPPTDLLLEGPTLYVGQVPVFWLPWLWLRAINRPGLLPPRVSWRGSDGLLVGQGFHIPVEFGEAQPAIWDTYVSGYFQGGIEVETQLTTKATTTAVRWDRLRQSLLAIESHGSSQGRHRGGIRWRVNAIRGARGRRGILELEAASRPYDRADVSLGTHQGPWTLGLGADATARRGGALGETGAVGPVLFGAFNRRFGADVTTAVDVELASRGQSRALTEQLLVQRSEFTYQPWIGPLALKTSVVQRLDSVSTEGGYLNELLLAGRLAVGLPLMRDFGALRHVIEPGFSVGVSSAHSDGSLDQYRKGRGSEAFVQAIAQAKTRLGPRLGYDGGEFEVGAGRLGLVDAADWAAVSQVRATTSWLTLASVTAVTLTREPAPMLFSSASLGPQEGPRLVGRLEGRPARSPRLARPLLGATRLSEVNWFNQRGWSAGAGTNVPIWHDFSWGGDLEYDLTSPSFLGARTEFSYRHPCGCLASGVWGQQRQGRRGVDIGFHVDLVPP